MGDSLVVDTCVLINATNDDGGRDRFLNCFSIVERLLNDDKVRLAVDSDWEVMTEYEQQLRNRRDHLAKVLKEYIIDQARVDSSKIVSFHIPIPESQVEELASLGFHSSDMKFVRIGPCSDLEVIVTTDERSFLKDDFKEWITSNLDVDVLTPRECVALLDGS